jgi:hypothetical protein
MTEYEYLLGNMQYTPYSRVGYSAPPALNVLRFMLVPGQGPRASKAPRLYFTCMRALSPNTFVSAFVPDRGMEQKASCCILYSFDSG